MLARSDLEPTSKCNFLISSSSSSSFFPDLIIHLGLYFRPFLLFSRPFIFLRHCQSFHSVVVVVSIPSTNFIPPPLPFIIDAIISSSQPGHSTSSKLEPNSIRSHHTVLKMKAHFDRFRHARTKDRMITDGISLTIMSAESKLTRG